MICYLKYSCYSNTDSYAALAVTVILNRVSNMKLETCNLKLNKNYSWQIKLRNYQ